MFRKLPLFLSWLLLALSALIALMIPDFYRYATYSFLPIIAILSLERSRDNLRPAFLLLLVAFSLGLLAEAHGVAYGLIFGGYYEYTFPPSLPVFGLPIQVGIFWAVFYYLCHSFANSIIRKNNHLYLILADAFLMTGLDFLLDPVMVAKGAWRWFKTGPYFGIPTGNFFGWFFVSLSIAFVVRKILKIKLIDQTSFATTALASTVGILLFEFFRLVTVSY